MAGEANTYCMGRINDRLCQARIPLTETLCNDCKIRKRGHTDECLHASKKDVAEYTCPCGFAQIFWRDVDQYEQAKKYWDKRNGKIEESTCAPAAD